jgi:hypothetical protein
MEPVGGVTQNECDCGCGSCQVPTQHCPVCREKMGAMPGSRDAICKNCGYKDPCCD